MLLTLVPVVSAALVRLLHATLMDVASVLLLLERRARVTPSFTRSVA